MTTDFIYRVTAQHSTNKPFVVYRKPNEHFVQAVLQNDDELNYLDSFLDTGFVFAPFNANQKTILLRCDEFLESTVSNTDTFKVEDLGLGVDEKQREFHTDLIKKALEEIHKGSLQKVVLSRKVEVTNKVAPFVLFQRLLSSYHNAFCYLWYHPKVGTWLGATPEILLKTGHGKITTMSLAGTQHFEGDIIPPWGTKEQEEQQLVTDYISNILMDKVTNLIVSERETVRAGNLLHLRTKLVASFDKARLGEIVDALHPTPAICGMPMQPSKNFILQNENYHREYYTGYLGELNMKRSVGRSKRKRNIENTVYKSIKSTNMLFVNLRCMQLIDRKALIYVGGGVTKDSNAEKEWEETQAKATTMLKVLSA